MSRTRIIKTLLLSGTLIISGYAWNLDSQSHPSFVLKAGNFESEINLITQSNLVNYLKKKFASVGKVYRNLATDKTDAKVTENALANLLHTNQNVIDAWTAIKKASVEYSKLAQDDCFLSKLDKKKTCEKVFEKQVRLKKSLDSKYSDLQKILHDKKQVEITAKSLLKEIDKTEKQLCGKSSSLDIEKMTDLGAAGPKKLQKNFDSKQAAKYEVEKMYSDSIWEDPTEISDPCDTLASAKKTIGHYLFVKQSGRSIASGSN